MKSLDYLMFTGVMAIAALATITIHIVAIPTINRILYRNSLEIYTAQDIYYLDGLTVTSESTDLNITFKNRSELARWIGERTADESVVSDWDIDDLLRHRTKVSYEGEFIKVHIINPHSGKEHEELYDLGQSWGVMDYSHLPLIIKGDRIGGYITKEGKIVFTDPPESNFATSDLIFNPERIHEPK